MVTDALLAFLFVEPTLDMRWFATVASREVQHLQPLLAFRPLDRLPRTYGWFRYASSDAVAMGPVTS